MPLHPPWHKWVHLGSQNDQTGTKHKKNSPVTHENGIWITTLSIWAEIIHLFIFILCMLLVYQSDYSSKKIWGFD